MKKLLLGLGLVVGIGVMCASNARAGNKASYPISVSSTSARGQVANVRASSNTSEFITCWTVVSSFPQVICIARNSAGVQKACNSMNPGLVAAAASINGDSFIEVGFTEDPFNQTTDCISLLVENGSTLAPKAP